MQRCQFSLLSLVSVVTLCGLACGIARLVPLPDLGAVDSTVWGGLAMVAGVAAASVFGIRWLNS